MTARPEHFRFHTGKKAGEKAPLPFAETSIRPA